MRHFADPRQNLLFDPAENLFSPMTIRYMNAEWPGLFRSQSDEHWHARCWEIIEKYDPDMFNNDSSYPKIGGVKLFAGYSNRDLTATPYYVYVTHKPKPEGLPTYALGPP